MNTITIVGNLVREPEVIFASTQNGDALCIAHFTIADNGWAKGEQTTIFWKCTAFGTVAETFGNEYMVGREYTVKGIAVPNDYVDKNGVKQHKIEIHAECYKNGRKPKSKASTNSATGSAETEKVPF